MSQESFVGEIDPISLEVINESFVAVVREMRANMVRTAYSSIIYEGHDFSCVLVDGEGQLVAMAEDNPVHIFPVPMEVGQMLERFGGDIHPGDVFIHNDPYTGGTHLNDVAIISPLFDGEQMAIYPVVRAHWGDVGGTTPGSISGKNTEILHDGVRIPILRIIEKGEINQGLLDLLLHNMRVPEERRGDFFAMLATCHTAHKRLEELAVKYDWRVILAAKDRLLDRAEASMRRRIAALPEGESTYEHFMDHDGHSIEPIRIRVRVQKTGDELIVDFRGTDPQTKGAYNVGPAMAPSASFSVIKAFFDPRGAINHGAFRPLTIRGRAGLPAFGAIPRELRGLDGGEPRRGFRSYRRHRALCVGRRYGRSSRARRTTSTSEGGTRKAGSLFSSTSSRRAARADLRKATATTPRATSRKEISPRFNRSRSSSRASRSRFRELSLRADSGGAGTRRGGLGLHREVEVLAESALLSISSDKNVIPPFGVLGGGPGKPNRFVVVRGV